MVLRSDKYYEQLAAKAVQEAGIAEPPVPIAAVAEHLGIPIVRMDLPPWFTGALIYEDGMPAILLNGSKDKHIQDAGIGHLVGHILILLDDPAADYPRDRLDTHREADTISAALAVPDFMVADQAAKWFNDYRYLARLFGVSEKRMLDKMQGMGLIKSRGIVWDY
ncbi:MAG: ImmA/IrrE family metallo-endopeptidase [Actinomycetia bacterium]|nr:ImmA/IrrE family metallo-endopeptidase [Actinomycetes bacterium]